MNEENQISEQQEDDDIDSLPMPGLKRSMSLNQADKQDERRKQTKVLQIIDEEEEIETVRLDQEDCLKACFQLAAWIATESGSQDQSVGSGVF